MGMGSDGTYLYQCGITSSHADSSVFLIKYNKSGIKVWEALTNKAIKTRSMDFASDGTLYLAATTNTLGAGAEDLIIMHYNNTNGELMDYKTWGGNDNESVQDIRIKDNFMYLTGRTVSYSANEFDDALLIKAPLFGNTSITTLPGKENVRVFPNPFSEKVVFQFENVINQPYTIIMYNSQGQVIRIIKDISSKLIDIKRNNLNAGIYFYQINDNYKIVASGKVLIK